MKFVLFYEGPLKGNKRTSSDKDLVRNQISPQLSQLWKDSEALEDLRGARQYEPREIGGAFFVPMAISAFRLVCDIDVRILSPSKKFGVLSGGDLDNRVKTLLDGLRMPKQPTEVSKQIRYSNYDDPIFVLLEDDNLVSRISATSDVLLGANRRDIETGTAKAVISVHLYPTLPTISTTALIS